MLGRTHPSTRHMAIDPYKPELAKRKTAFEIASEQLCEIMEELNRCGSDFRAHMEQADEALNDYRNAGFSLAEWLDQEKGD